MSTENIFESKHLDKETATSILCSKEILEDSERVEMVAKSKPFKIGKVPIVTDQNIYYRVIGTNTVIMYVEDGFCILIDYKVKTYNEENLCSLPVMLEASKYRVYQYNGRDWISNSATRLNIGYDIKRLIHGDGCYIAGKDQLDHLAETFDEREKHKEFGPNLGRKSHRTIVEIKSQKKLNEVIDKIIENEDENQAIWYKRKKKK